MPQDLKSACRDAFYAGANFGFIRASENSVLNRTVRDRAFENYLKEKADAERKYPH